MKKMRFLLCLVVMITISTVSAYAAGIHFETTPLPSEDEDGKEALCQGITALPPRQPYGLFLSYSASDDGSFAVCYTWNKKVKRICVFQPDGTFDYGFMIDWNRNFRYEKLVSSEENREKFLSMNAEVQQINGITYRSKLAPELSSLIGSEKDCFKIVKTENGKDTVIHGDSTVSNFEKGSVILAWAIIPPINAFIAYRIIRRNVKRAKAKKAQNCE